MPAAWAFAAGAAVGAALAAIAGARRLKRREQELGRLLSFAAHELNTPVTAVNMTIMNFTSGAFGEVAEGQMKWLEMTREQLARLTGLLGELRDFTHLRLRREFQENLEDARPEELVTQAVGALRRGFEQAGAELEVSVPPGLPAVRADVERATRSLASLLFHARKFRLSGPVSIAASVAGAAVEFAVRYKGPRLTPAEIAASLDEEHPGRPRKDNILSATGLGLGVTRMVLERTGGRLAYAVGPEGDSTLTVSLPAAGAGR